MINEINKYLRFQKGNFQSLKNFKNSGLHHFYENAFGELIFTEEKTHHFIGVDKDFNFYDEIYYPQDNFSKKGTFIPKIFFELGIDLRDPDPIWNQVSKRGFAVLPEVTIPKSFAEQALSESFVPFGMNEDLNMAKTILHPYFASQANYAEPEIHQNPKYMSELTEVILQQIPAPPLVIEKYILHTADIVKYIYDEKDSKSKVGPYRFHMDFVPRNLVMFFNYFSKIQPILGRELLIGQKNDFKDFSKSSLNPMPGTDTPEVFLSLEDNEVSHYEMLKIQNNTVILMNTLNPMFVHRVNKLEHSNEVVLLTHYLWSK